MTVSKQDNGNTSVFAVMDTRRKAIREHFEKLEKDSFYRRLFLLASKKGRKR